MQPLALMALTASDVALFPRPPRRHLTESHGKPQRSSLFARVRRAMRAATPHRVTPRLERYPF